MKTHSIGKAAFNAVYETHVDSVYRVALKYTKNEHTAEEITQNVFLKLYTYMDHIDMEAVRKWLLVTAKNMALNHNRRDKREVLFAEFFEEEWEHLRMEGPENVHLQKIHERKYVELTEDIFAHLYQNNRRWYEAVTTTYCLKKPQREVAEIMGIKVETLHSMLHRAKEWIRKNYEERYEWLDKA